MDRTVQNFRSLLAIHLGLSNECRKYQRRESEGRDNILNAFEEACGKKERQIGKIERESPDRMGALWQSIHRKLILLLKKNFQKEHRFRDGPHLNCIRERNRPLESGTEEGKTCVMCASQFKRGENGRHASHLNFTVYLHMGRETERQVKIRCGYTDRLWSMITNEGFHDQETRAKHTRRGTHRGTS